VTGNGGRMRWQWQDQAAATRTVAAAGG